MIPGSKKTDPRQLRDLAARATPLFERFAGRVVAAPAEDDDSLAAVRLEKWQQVLGGDGEALIRRLALENLDAADCRQVLGRVQLPLDQPMPVWAQDLEAILDRCTAAEWN